MPVINEGQLQTGSLKGARHGATISLILNHSKPGQGPRLHRHPYDEMWVVIDGNLTFQNGEERLKAGPGDIVIVPPGAPHKFVNNGPGRSHLVCIHANPTMVTEWLECASASVIQAGIDDLGESTMNATPAWQTRSCGFVDPSVERTDSPAFRRPRVRAPARAGTDQRSRCRAPRGLLAKIGSDLLVANCATGGVVGRQAP